VIVAAIGLCCGNQVPPASANEASRQLIRDAAQLVGATPPQPVEALAKLREATTADPKDALAWFVRGGHALTQYLAKEALESFDKAAALNPKLANLQFLRGRALQELGRSGPALAAFNREPNKNGNRLFYFYRGLANMQAKNSTAALADFARSDTAFEAGRQATQLHRGDIFAAQRRIADARQAYQRVFAIDPKSPVVATAQARLKILDTPAVRGRQSGRPAKERKPRPALRSRE
jgi:tetratricopeptide (TPR) repeat protein